MVTLGAITPVTADPVDNGSVASVTDQSSLDGTSLDQNDPDSSLGSAGSLTSVLGGASESVSGGGSLSSFASTGSAEDSLGSGSLGSLGCAIGSTGVTGSGSIGSSGGLGHSVPWLNGQTGALPSVGGATSPVRHVTGPSSPNDTVERFNVLGTDLGIMWDDGTGATMLAFGDTIGAADDPICNGLTGNWRSNVLLRSADTDLSDGMDINGAALSSPGQAREILPSLKQPGIEHTVIPTAGISVPHDGAQDGYRQYIDFMSVKSWGTVPGEWTTNYSALAYSDDGGDSWISPTFGMIPQLNPDNAVSTGQAALDSVRLDDGGNANFQMGAFVRDHTQDADDPDSYVYLFGTPSGRNGSAELSRVRQKNIATASKYEYWDGSGWTGDVEDATVVLDGKVSELSVDYNEYLGKYIAMYTKPLSGLVVRTADDLTGPWSSPRTLINPAQVPSIYGGYMHPVSNASGSRYLYFVATTWSDYNVMLLRTDLNAV